MNQQKTLKEVLEGKLAAAKAEGKVLNVSNLREDGVGAVKAKTPATQGRDAKGKIKYIAGLDIISDNYGTYKVAAMALGHPEFAKMYREYYGGGVASPKVAKSPKKEKAVPKNFEEKLMEAVMNAQNEDKLVDVSNLHELKNGSLGGFRTVARYDPKTGKDTYLEKYTGKKMWIQGLPMISNNFDSYARAANALDRADLVREFARMHGEDYDHRTVKGAKSPAKSPGKKGPAQKLGAAEQLYEMYSKAVNSGGKLDVSNLDASKGTGSRVIHPKTDREITKVGVDGIEVVSNSYEKFAEAMALLDEVYSAGGQETNFYEFANEYMAQHKEGPGKRVLGASPKPKTPKRVRAKSIPKAGSAESSGSTGRARSPGKMANNENLAERLARAASQERLMRSASRERLARAASQERLARAASQERMRSRSGSRSGSAGSRSGSAGSRSGSAGLLPVPNMV